MSLEDLMPEPLLLMGPGGLAVWQWIGLAVVLVVAAGIGRAGAWLFTWIGAKVVGRTSTNLDDELLAKLRSPLRALASIGLIRIGMVPLALPPTAERIVHEFLLAGFALSLVWGALRSIDVMSSHLGRAGWAVERPSTRSLLLLLSRIAKALVVIIAGIGFLSGIGLPVASLLAGLGIGGIALAFGAQKTVENLFGAVAIGVDRPFREGDFVKVEDHVMGTVEEVGLRSTRFRTADRTIVTLPNGRLSDMRIETYTVRDRIRLACVLNLVYETTAKQMREILAGCEKVLRDHPALWPDEVSVRFMQLGESSLDVEVIAWFRTTDFGKFKVMRQEVLLGFMQVVEDAGSAFAFPTRTVHLVEQNAAKPRSARRA
ncbi:MAG TPA: mechanosensitive ion channel family protein [Kofleriaceae bacterium]|nr:mechanosensitive ion channel family protein [Kofleriaceae bacterium]